MAGIRRMNFIASVRLLNGEKQLFRVSGAKDYEDARTTIREDVMGAKTVLLWRVPPQPWLEQLESAA